MSREKKVKKPKGKLGKLEKRDLAASLVFAAFIAVIVLERIFI